MESIIFETQQLNRELTDIFQILSRCIVLKYDVIVTIINTKMQSIASTFLTNSCPYCQ